MTFQPPAFGRKAILPGTGSAPSTPSASPQPNAPTPQAPETAASPDDVAAALKRFHAAEDARKRAQFEAGPSSLNYEIQGADLQIVEIELAPGESVIAEAGAMIWKDFEIEMSAILGDGADEDAGLLGKLAGAGKRVLTGESLFATEFTHNGFNDKACVAFAAPTPGKILPIYLPDVGGSLICQKDSFLAAAKGVKVGIHLQKKIMSGLFSGEGFIMQKLEGEGWAFVQMGGTLVERELRQGERIHVDTGCVAAFTSGVDFNVVSVGGIKNPLLGGEGLFFAALTGPGKVWIQSMPFARLAARILAFSRPSHGENGGEGGLLGGLLQGRN